MIQREGVDSLTVAELQSACQARAMRAYGVSEDKLKAQLLQWLDLSLNEKVPPSLLLLSRSLMLPDTIPATDQLKATISALPDTVVSTMATQVLFMIMLHVMLMLQELKAKAAIEEREGHIDNVTKIQLIKEEEKKIKEERAEQREEAKRQKESEEKEMLVDKAPIISAETVLATATPPAEKKPTEQKVEELSTKDLEALEDALDALGKAKKRLIVEKEELDELKEEMQEYQEVSDKEGSLLIKFTNEFYFKYIVSHCTWLSSNQVIFVLANVSQLS
jgi:LETM1 and EF-hand domain-containing protein 1